MSKEMEQEAYPIHQESVRALRIVLKFGTFGDVVKVEKV
jgi:hypothetical protein